MSVRTVRIDAPRSAEQPRREVVQVASPRLPLVVGAWRLPVDVFDPGVLQRLVEAADALAHPFGLGGADAQPEHANLLGERLRIGERAVEVGLRIEGPAAEAAGTAEA